MIVACGNYTGGALKCCPNDDHKIAPDKLEDVGSETHDINCKPLYFDGTKAHSTEPFTGTRYSFVFFCIKRITQLPEDQCQYLNDLGFVLPSIARIVVQGLNSKEEAGNAVPITAECNMGETVTTMEGIGRHYQFQLESNQSPYTQAARGLQRRHMKGQGTSHHVLSFDLAGPHPPACGHSFVYALVGVYFVEHAGENIPLVRGLKRKTGEEVSTALKSIFAEIQCILGEPLILKAHSDAGGEFINQQMEALLIKEGRWQTKTAGYDPKGNGRVERYVGILKHRATMFLLRTKCPWHFGFGQ